MNFSSHCSQIYCLALQFFPSLININIESFSFPSDQLIELSRLENVGCLFHQMHRLGYKIVHIDRMLFFNTIFVVIVHFPGNLWLAAFAILAISLLCTDEHGEEK